MRGRRWIFLSLASAASLAAACARATRGLLHDEPCTLAAGDSVLLSDGPVYRDCAVDAPARLLTPAADLDVIDFEPPPGQASCFSADVGFVVDTTGRVDPSSVAILHSTNAQYARAVATAVTKWRYSPARLHGVRVRQIVTDHRMLVTPVAPLSAGSLPSSAASGAVPSC